MGSNSEIQGYNVYPMLHFCRKFSSSITVGRISEVRDEGKWVLVFFCDFVESIEIYVELEGSIFLLYK